MDSNNMALHNQYTQLPIAILTVFGYGLPSCMASDPMQLLANNPEISSNGVTNMKQFQGQIQTFEKGHRFFLYLYMSSLLMWASWDIAILLQCAKHANTRGSGGMPCRNFEKLHCLRLNLRVLLVNFYPFMFLYIQVD